MLTIQTGNAIYGFWNKKECYNRPIFFNFLRIMWFIVIAAIFNQ